MTSKHKREYAIDHKLAKLLVCIINTVLFVMVFKTEHYIGFFFINATYFFGVNTISRVLETTFSHRRKHDWF